MLVLRSLLLILLSLVLSTEARGEVDSDRTRSTPASEESGAVTYGPWGVDLEGMDRSVRPGDDFFRYVNGKWEDSTEIPRDRSQFGVLHVLRDLSEARVRSILDRWYADEALHPDSEEAKVATIYRTFLDESAAVTLDTKPIEPHLRAVQEAETHDDMARLMAATHERFGSSFFQASVWDDPKNPDCYVVFMWQSGLGLPDRDSYLREDLEPQKQRYRSYVEQMLRLIEWDEPESRADEIVALETRMARAHWTRAESRDRDRTYNLTTFDELEKDETGFPWRAFLEEARLWHAGRAVIRQNTAFPKLALIFSEAPLTTLKAWAAFHIADTSAPFLSKRFVDAEWEFRSKFLNGALEQQPRWKRAVAFAELAAGEAIGRTYVAEHFPPDSKVKVEELVSDLRAAMKARIESLSWMGPETRKRALDKLSKFRVKIGYPSKWLDYSTLEVREGEAAGNAERSMKFYWDNLVGRIDQPVDKDEWGMTPQTVNAYYSMPKNEIVFPAAILQPPYFDPNADPAVNYGAIGAVIGHELTHGFDDRGRKSDGDGVLRDWWAPEDAARFEERATRLGAQYEKLTIPQLEGMRISPRLTMGENIADLGGVVLALEAYERSGDGEPAQALDGFTDRQRFFLGWAQVWRRLYRDEALRQHLLNNGHAPARVRSFAPLRNVDAWYEAFDVNEGDEHYLAPEDRVRIW